MEVVETHEEAVPVYAVTYLEYGDSGQTDPEDGLAADEWLAEYSEDAEGKGCRVVLDWDSGDPYFTRYPAFGKPCDCVGCRVLFVKE